MATAEVSDPRNGSKRRRSSPSGSPASANSLIDEPPIKRSRNQDPGQGLNEISVTVSDLNATCVIVAESPGKVALANLVAAVESIVDVIRVAETTRENDSDCEYLKILIQNLKDLSLNPAAGSRVDKGRIDDLKKELTEINDQYHETCVNTHLHPCTNINSTGVIVALKSALQHTLQYLMQNPFLGESIGHGSAATIVANSSIDVSIPSLFGSSSKEIILDTSTSAHDIHSLNLSTRVITGQKTNCGGYSDIFRGTLKMNDKQIQVAVKVLRVQGYMEKIAIEERLRKRLYREVFLWRRLQHSNVVPLLGYVILSDGLPGLVSPWYINGNVTHYLQLHPTSDRLSLSLDVVRGLEYLHSIQVTHGDLKGENVLVDASGHASLCDFGMSQFIDEVNRISGFTTTHAYVGGTDRFMCPELFEDEPKTLATDVWALGCLVAQIITGEVPYRNITRKQAIPQAILRGDPPMMNVTGTVAQSLWNCIEKCWSMVPNDRPHTSEVGEQLLHLLSQQKQQEQKQQQQQQQQQENLQMPLEPSVDIWQGPLVFNYPTLQLDTFNIKTSRKQHIWVCAKSLQSTDGAGLFVHWPLRLAFTSFEFQNINLDSILKLVEEKSIPLCLFNPINSKIEGTTEATTVNEDEYKRLVALLAEEEAGICLYSSAPDCVHNSGVLLFTRNTGENDIQLIGAVFSTISIPPLNGHLFYWKIPNEPPLLRHEVINRCSQRRYSHGQQQRQLEQQQAAPTPHAQVQAHNSGGEFGSALGMGSGANTDSSLLSNNQHPAHFQGASTNSASTGSPAEAAVDWFTDCLKEYRFP